MEKIELQRTQRLIAKGKDITHDVVSCYFDGNTKKYQILFKSGKQWKYNQCNVSIISSLDYFIGVASLLKIPEPVGETNNRPEVAIEEKEEGESFLEKELKNIDVTVSDTVLYSYLNCSEIRTIPLSGTIIYPFGSNRSQMEAVQMALTHNISLIEGPPGTGKTQTILNIIANLIKNKKTVGVVSGNNSATSNIAEKLQKYGYGDILATLGKYDNREAYFLQNHAPIKTFSVDASKIQENECRLEELVGKLRELLCLDDRLSELRKEKKDLLLEWDYFHKNTDLSVPQYIRIHDALKDRRYTAKKWLELKNYCESWREYGKYAYNRFAGCLDDILIYTKTFFHYRIPLMISTYKDVQILADYAGEMFYQVSLSELDQEYGRLCELLAKGRMDELSKECQELSQTIFRHNLNVNIKRTDIAFTLENYKKQFNEFISQVPVITSTTHAVRKSIPSDFVFDYILIDESSQVDLITAIIAMSCCRNIVIVGDSMQLPQIVPSEVVPQAREYARQMQVHPSYDYAKQSIISSLKAIYPNLPTVLLREHYRCHPLIIDFCNQQFYDKKLIIKSEWTDPEDGNHPLAIITVRHADRKRPCADYKGRSWVNKLEQLKVCEEFNRLTCSGITDIGVITPFRSHANAINKLCEEICADTIHKFQGREKEVVIFSMVKDKVKVDEEWEASYSTDKRVDFINQSELINVAVSRAKNRLELVMSQLLFEQAPLSTNIGNLIRYIKYNGGEISFQSIFDYLYHHNLDTDRERSLHRLFGSWYASENLMHELILNIIERDSRFSNFDVIANYPLRNIVGREIELTSRQRAFVRRNSHVDFLIYNKCDKMPVLAVEVNGSQHDQPVQRERDAIKQSILDLCGVPLLPLSTRGKNEEQQIIRKLSVIIESACCSEL